MGGAVAGAVDDPSRVPVLDGIRGLAILLVLVCHFSLFSGVEPGTLADRIYFDLTLPLGCGVDLFFVLSGFLISGILLDTRDGPGYFRSFYMRRVLRIFPLYYGFLLFFYHGLPWIMTPGEGFEALMGAQAWDWAYLSNFRVALHGWQRPEYVSHFWSLAIEEQFYLVWPTVVLLLPRRRFMALCVGLLVLCLGVRWQQWAGGASYLREYLTHARLDGLVTGALLAGLARGPGGLRRLRPWAAGVGGVSLLALVHLVTSQGRYDRDLMLERVFLQTLYAAFFGSLLVLVVTGRPGSLLHRAFSRRTLVFLGIYSYGLYVLHQPLLVYASTHGLGASFVPTVFGSRLPGVLAVAIVGGALSIGAAVLSHHLYELRFLRLKKFFQAGRRPHRVVRAPGESR